MSKRILISTTVARVDGPLIAGKVYELPDAIADDVVKAGQGVEAGPEQTPGELREKLSAVEGENRRLREQLAAGREAREKRADASTPGDKPKGKAVEAVGREPGRPPAFPVASPSAVATPTAGDFAAVRLPTPATAAPGGLMPAAAAVSATPPPEGATGSTAAADPGFGNDKFGPDGQFAPAGGTGQVAAPPSPAGEPPVAPLPGPGTEANAASTAELTQAKAGQGTGGPGVNAVASAATSSPATDGGNPTPGDPASAVNRGPDVITPTAEFVARGKASGKAGKAADATPKVKAAPKPKGAAKPRGAGKAAK